MAQLKIVPHYGIHWDENGVAYLMQGRGGTNAIGLRERAPFQVELPNRSKHCNHQIPLSTPVPNDHHWDFFLQLLDDPLVRAMLPIPKKAGGVYYLADPNGEALDVLLMLSKLSSPIYSTVVPVWSLTEQAIITELQQTNVQPLVLTQMEPKNSDLLSRVARAAVHLPRTVVFSGAEDVVVPPAAKRITTELTSGKYPFEDLMTLPWESLGAVVVRKYMRREWPPRAEAIEPGQPKAKSPPIRGRRPA